MKYIINFFILLLVSFSFYSCETDDDDFNDSPNNKIITEFSYSVNELNTSLHNFVIKSQEFESSNFSTMSIKDIQTIMEEYIFAGEQYVNAMKEIEDIQQKTKNSTLKKKADGPSCSAVDFIPGADNGLGVGFVKGVGDLIQGAEDDIAALDKKLEKGEIDDNEYYDKVNKLKTDHLTKAASVTLGTLLATGAAYVTGAVVGTATLPAIATITVVGAAVGSIVTWYSYSYATGENKGTNQKHFMLTGKTTVGGKLPIHFFHDNSNVIISVDGYAPVTLNNFKLPKSGLNKIIDIDGVKLQDAKFGGSTMVCFSEEKMTAFSCEEIEFVTGVPNPSDPAPGQGVTVTATLIPAFSNCNISFSIVGTDGYSKSSTTPSDAAGQASFYIPGGSKKVVDVVTITSSNGKTYKVTYVF